MSLPLLRRAARPRGARRSGLTLIEMILALGLFAMLALFVMGILRSVLGIWQISERQGRGDLVFASAMERMQADLQALHTGRRGWLVLDRYEAVPAKEEELAWSLPRLRFLARGAGLPADDPTGRRAWEVAWLLVPENASSSRLARLVRLVQPEEQADTLRSDRVVAALLREGFGLTVLDGVAWARFDMEDVDGERRDALVVEAGQPVDFPAVLHVGIERVAGNARRRPAVLDDPVDAAVQPVVLRGSQPARIPEYALVEKEWVRLNGQWPRPGLSERGARGTIARSHDRGAIVWLPEAWTARGMLPAGGRRLP